MLNKKALAASLSAVPATYVEDVFSTYLYTGTGSAQTITNGINLSGEGGLVWIKNRNNAVSHGLYDTVRGATYWLASNTTSAQTAQAQHLTVFNNNGFDLGTSSIVNGTVGSAVYTSWTFRKAEKFFDVVTYTGNGSNQSISHNLGSVPGFVVIKRTDTTGNWSCWHRSIGNNYLLLNTTSKSTATGNTDRTVTSSTFEIYGNFPDEGANGSSYVMYLFAHDAGGFGDAGTDSIIKCGSFTTDGSGEASVTLDWEPQWVMLKKTSNTGSWWMMDTMRGYNVSGNDKLLNTNSDGAEQDADEGYPTATGFYVKGEAATSTYAYIAIRRGPMKTPEAGTEVFTPITKTADAPTATLSEIGFQFDTVFNSATGGTYGGDISYSNALSSRLTGLGSSSCNALFTSATDAETSYVHSKWNGQTFSVGSAWVSTKFIWYFLKRAPGFFDTVCYTGNGANRSLSHNLGTTPELMIVKRRSATNSWAVYANNDNTDYLVLNSSAATADDNTYWNDTSPTSSVFSVGTNNAVNGDQSTYVAYLFASCTGVSKVGTYTGTGTGAGQTINCGFTNGARFVLIKRIDSAGDWYVFDSARGIVAGNDPFLALNTTNAEDANYDAVDTANSGFVVNQVSGGPSVNMYTGTYIFLAIA